MTYIYPKLSENDLLITRIGGPGLGNLLFVYAKAFCLSKKNNIPLIWPTWNTIKIGTILRKEKDKRFYSNVFKNNCNSVSGLKKMLLLLTKPKIVIKEINDFDIKLAKDKIIQISPKKIEFDNTLFKDILEMRKEIYENLKKNAVNSKDIQFDFSNSIVVNIRLGDFETVSEEELKNGADNSRIPIYWYINIINQIRKILGKDIKVYISSDGTDEELKEILGLKNTEKITFSDSLSTILTLSKAPLFIGSGSTFSLWIRYLGQMSSISYKNQYKEKVLIEKENCFEIDTEGLIDEKYYEIIKKIYKEN